MQQGAGVHRGGEASLDISADLEELGRTPVTVVCAGAKAILDLPRTLEYLETRGVPVVGFGTDQLPAFWSRESPWRVPMRVDRAEDVAALMVARQALGLVAVHEFEGAVEQSDVCINLAGRSVDCRYNDANRRSIFESRA